MERMVGNLQSKEVILEALSSKALGSLAPEDSFVKWPVILYLYGDVNLYLLVSHDIDNDIYDCSLYKVDLYTLISTSMESVSKETPFSQAKNENIYLCIKEAIDKALQLLMFGDLEEKNQEDTEL